jgi:hypothetical protein
MWTNTFHSREARIRRYLRTKQTNINICVTSNVILIRHQSMSCCLIPHIKYLFQIPSSHRILVSVSAILILPLLRFPRVSWRVSCRANGAYSFAQRYLTSVNEFGKLLLSFLSVLSYLSLYPMLQQNFTAGSSGGELGNRYEHFIHWAIFHTPLNFCP